MKKNLKAFVTYNRLRLDSLVDRLQLKSLNNRLRVTSTIGYYLGYIFKALEEYISTSEIFSKNITKTLADLVGSINILIQKSIVKAKLDLLSSTELTEKYFSRKLSDNQEVVELVRKELSKITADSINSSDYINIQMQYNRSYVELDVALDVTSKIIQKNISDNLSVLDVFDIVLFITNKIFSDATQTQDSLIKTYSKILSDDIGSTDLFKRVVQTLRYFSELVSTQDPITKASTKDKQDFINAIDDFYIEFNKIPTDNITSTTVGRLLNQNYCSSPNYFNDDYTGDKRTFN